MLSGFQIRAARAYTKLYIQDVSSAVGIHKSTLTRLEANTQNLSYLNCNTRTSLLIKKFYENKNIIFPTINSIGVNSSMENSKNDVLNKFQFKVSRIAIRLNRKTLGNLIDVAESTIEGWETQQNPLLPIKCNSSNAKKIKIAKLYFLDHGIIYPDHNIVELLDDPAQDVKKSI